MAKTAASKTATTKRCVKESEFPPSLVPLNLGRFSLVANFVDFVKPKLTRDDIVLSSENLCVISSNALEYEKRDTLRRHGQAFVIGYFFADRLVVVKRYQLKFSLMR